MAPIDSISAFLNDENVHNFNPIPLEHYISQNINYFVQEQTRLNKKIKLNKSYFNNKNYYNTFPSNPKQRICNSIYIFLATYVLFNIYKVHP